MWMNECEIDSAVERFRHDPVLGPATRFLSEFRHQVNEHSDGWPYWKPAGDSAAKLMDLIHRQQYSGCGAYARVAATNIQEVRKAIVPIKSFMTRRGYKAGMTMPQVEL